MPKKLIEVALPLEASNAKSIAADFEVKKTYFDYTQWQRMHYDAIPEEDLQKSIDEYSKTHTFHGKKAKIL